MKKAMLAFFLLTALCSTVYGQTINRTTTTDEWNSASVQTRLDFTLGFLVGLQQAAYYSEINGLESLRLISAISTEADIKDLAIAMTVFYMNPENANTPLASAMLDCILSVSSAGKPD